MLGVLAQRSCAATLCALNMTQCSSVIAGFGGASIDAGPARKKQRLIDMNKREDFEPYFHLTHEGAAAELGVTKSTFQKAWSAVSAPLNCSGTPVMCEVRTRLLDMAPTWACN